MLFCRERETFVNKRRVSSSASRIYPLQFYDEKKIKISNNPN